MTTLSDLEIVRLCAEAMDLTPYRAVSGGVIQHCSESGIYVVSDRDARGYTEYDPLHDRAQCFELVEKLKLTVDFFAKEWTAMSHSPLYVRDASSDNLNRAICECAARVQMGKEQAK